MDRTLLLFGHSGARYGIDVSAVREIVWLPELSPVEELPAHIAGVFNLGGKVVPVMDLGLRFGHPPRRYQLGDRVIVLDCADGKVGIVANELHAVVVVPPTAIESVSTYQCPGGHAQFVSGEAKLDDGLAMLLDVDALLRSVPTEAALSSPANAIGAEHARLFENLSSAESEIFRARAHGLARIAEAGERDGLESFALIRLDSEFFGLELDVVREFSHLRSTTPLPCCPPHFVGNMNLRGDILTVVDIRPALGLDMNAAMGEVVVVRVGDLRLGLAATEIVDVVHVAEDEIASIPVASGHADKPYCKGVAVLDGRAVSILDLEKLLTARDFQVAEEVT